MAHGVVGCGRLLWRPICPLLTTCALGSDCARACPIPPGAFHVVWQAAHAVGHKEKGVRALKLPWRSSRNPLRVERGGLAWGH